MIKIKHLTKVYETINYNVVALSNLNFDFEKGEVVVILGRSGSGKSTFLNVLGGFDNTYSGSYFFDNHEFKTLEFDKIDELRSKKIGFIFQHQVLFNNLTVLENVELSLNVLGVTNSKRKRINARKALTLVGLRSHMFKKPWQLSGGEKQRVAIARAIVKDPDVIICDEPTAALDSVTSKEVLDLLASVCKNKLLIIATHNKSIVKNYGTRIIELKSGYVVKDELVKDDKSNIQIDEMDKLIDSELYENEENENQELINEQLAEKVDQSQILRDLELDLSQYKERKETEFVIDSKQKDELIQKRKDNVTLEERFDSFNSSQEMAVEIKRFAKSSIWIHRRTYFFFSFFLTCFMLISIVGINLTGGIFLKSDNTENINYKLFEENKLVQLRPLEETGLFIDETLSEDGLKQKFINNTNFDEFSAKDNDILLNDYSFNYRYISDMYTKIGTYLDELGKENSYALYYDPQNIVLGTSEDSDEIIFDNLKTRYEVVNVQSRLQMTNFIEKEVSSNVTPIYIENNSLLVQEYLIGDSRLPKEADEVLISVNTLIESDILGMKNYSNINEVYKKFNELDDEKKFIVLNTPTITIKPNTQEEVEGPYLVEEKEGNEMLVNRFKIVGIYNAGDDIESYYTNKKTVKMFFSKKAQNLLTIQVNNELEGYQAELIPLYMEINNDLYNQENLGSVITKLQNRYLEDEYAKMYQVILEYIKPLEDALVELSEYLNGNNDLNVKSKVSQEYFPNLTYGTLLDEYVKNYYILFSSQERATLCSSCKNYGIKDTDIALSLKDSNGLAYERTISKLFFEQHWKNFNHSYHDYRDTSSLKLSNTNDLENSSYYNLLKNTQSMTKRFGLSSLGISDDALKSFILKAGKLLVDPSIILKGLSSGASNILIVVLMSILTFILSILFNNIYQLFLVNRRMEFGSLRILGAKYGDINRIIKREGQILLWFSYGFVVMSLIIIKITSNNMRNNALVFFVYQPLNHFFVNIRMTDFFNFNLFSLISVFILMQVIFKKELIDENIDKNLKDMNMLKSITDWDGE